MVLKDLRRNIARTTLCKWWTGDTTKHHNAAIAVMVANDIPEITEKYSLLQACNYQLLPIMKGIHLLARGCLLFTSISKHHVPLKVAAFLFNIINIQRFKIWKLVAMKYWRGLYPCINIRHRFPDIFRIIENYLWITTQRNMQQQH